MKLIKKLFTVSKMWKKIGDIEGLWCSITLSKDLHIFRNSNLNINDIKPNPTLELISLKPTIETVWQQEGQSPLIFHREYYGDIYCSSDDKNLYQLNAHTGLSLFISGATYGRFLGPNIFMYSNALPALAPMMGVDLTLTAVDAITKKTLWQKTLSDRQRYGEHALTPHDADLVLLDSKTPPDADNTSTYNGVEALSAVDGSSLWRCDFPQHYDSGRFTCTPNHLIYVLYLEGYNSTNPESGYDTKIHVRNKHTGELVSVIDDAPSTYYLGCRYSSGRLFGCNTNNLYAIDPINEKSFHSFNIAPEMQDETFRIIGEIDNKLIIASAVRIDKEYKVLVVHFDLGRNEVTYTQLIDDPFPTFHDFNIVNGFLFVVDKSGTNQIYEWKT